MISFWQLLLFFIFFFLFYGNMPQRFKELQKIYRFFVTEFKKTVKKLQKDAVYF